MAQAALIADALKTYALIAGTDEVGRGPLAGDVVAAAVILYPKKPIAGLGDSKKLTAKQREACFEAIVRDAKCYALGRASVAEIEAINILQASLLAMQRAIVALTIQPQFVFVDGNRCPKWSYPSLAIINGDSLIPSISAASIIAKVSRDREMQILDREFPGYGFASNMGYPTPAHLAALQSLGASAVHRRTFAPVARILQQS